MPSMSSMSCVHMNIGPTLPHSCFYILYSCSIQTTVTFEMAEVFQFLGQDSVYQSGFICVMCSYLLSICRITTWFTIFGPRYYSKTPIFLLLWLWNGTWFTPMCFYRTLAALRSPTVESNSHFLWLQIMDQGQGCMHSQGCFQQLYKVLSVIVQGFIILSSKEIVETICN